LTVSIGNQTIALCIDARVLGDVPLSTMRFKRKIKLTFQIYVTDNITQIE